MRMVGTIAVGMVAFLASPAQAELPVYDEERVSWQGCAYSIKILQLEESGQPYPEPRYRVSLQSEVVSPDTCSLTPRTVDLVDSMSVPQIEIAASAEGLAIAYSYEEYARFSWSRHYVRIHHLDPSTLGFVRTAQLEGLWVSEPDGWYAPAPIYLNRLILRPGSLEVNGYLGVGANSLSDDSATSWPPPIAQGDQFVAIYPDFFGATRQPPQIHTY